MGGVKLETKAVGEATVEAMWELEATATAMALKMVMDQYRVKGLLTFRQQLC